MLGVALSWDELELGFDTRPKPWHSLFFKSFEHFKRLRHVLLFILFIGVPFIWNLTSMVTFWTVIDIFLRADVYENFSWLLIFNVSYSILLLFFKFLNFCTIMILILTWFTTLLQNHPIYTWKITKWKPRKVLDKM